MPPKRPFIPTFLDDDDDDLLILPPPPAPSASATSTPMTAEVIASDDEEDRFGFLGDPIRQQGDFTTAAGNAVRPRQHSSSTTTTTSINNNLGGSTRTPSAATAPSSSTAPPVVGGAFKPPRSLKDYFNRANAMQQQQQQQQQGGTTAAASSAASSSAAMANTTFSSTAAAFAKDLIERHDKDHQQQQQQQKKKRSQWVDGGDATPYTVPRNTNVFSSLPLKMRMSLGGVKGCPIPTMASTNKGTSQQAASEYEAYYKRRHKTAASTSGNAKVGNDEEDHLSGGFFGADGEARHEHHDIYLSAHPLYPSNNGSLLMGAGGHIGAGTSTTAAQPIENASVAAASAPSSSSTPLPVAAGVAGRPHPAAMAQQKLRDTLFMYHARRDVFGRSTDHMTSSRCSTHQALRGDPIVTVARLAATDDFSSSGNTGGGNMRGSGVYRGDDEEDDGGDEDEDDEANDGTNNNNRRRRGGGRALRVTDISRAIAGASASAVRSITITNTGRAVFAKKHSLEIFDLNTLFRAHSVEVERNETRVLSAGGSAENDCHRFRDNQDVVFALMTYGHLRPFNINENARSNFRNLANIPRGGGLGGAASDLHALMGLGGGGGQSPSSSSSFSVLMDNLYYRPLPTWDNLDYFGRCEDFAQFVERLRRHKKEMLLRMHEDSGDDDDNNNGGPTVIEDSDEDDNATTTAATSAAAGNNRIDFSRSHFSPQQQSGHANSERGQLSQSRSSTVGTLIPAIAADIVADSRFTPRTEGNGNVRYPSRSAPLSFPITSSAGGAPSRHHMAVMEPFTGALATSDGNAVSIVVTGDASELSVRNSNHSAPSHQQQQFGRGVGLGPTAVMTATIPQHNAVPNVPYSMRPESMVLIAIPHKRGSEEEEGDDRNTAPSHSHSQQQRELSDTVNSLLCLIGTHDGRLIVYQSLSKGHRGNNNHHDNGDDSPPPEFGPFRQIAVASVAVAIDKKSRREEESKKREWEKNCTNTSAATASLGGPVAKGLSAVASSSSARGHDDSLVLEFEQSNTFMGKPLGYYAVTSLAYCDGSSISGRASAAMATKKHSHQQPSSVDSLIVYCGTACGDIVAWEVPYTYQCNDETTNNARSDTAAVGMSGQSNSHGNSSAVAMSNPSLANYRYGSSNAVDDDDDDDSMAYLYRTRRGAAPLSASSPPSSLRAHRRRPADAASVASGERVISPPALAMAPIVIPAPLAVLGIAKQFGALKALVGSTHISQIVVPQPAFTTTTRDALPLLAPPPLTPIVWASVAAGGLCRLSLVNNKWPSSSHNGDAEVGGETDALVTDAVAVQTFEGWQYPELGRGGRGGGGGAVDHLYSGGDDYRSPQQLSMSSPRQTHQSHLRTSASLLDFGSGVPFAVLHDTAFWPHLTSMRVLVAMPSNLAHLRSRVTITTTAMADSNGGDGRSLRIATALATYQRRQQASAASALPPITLAVANPAHRYVGHQGAVCHGFEEESAFRAKRTIAIRVAVDQCSTQKKEKNVMPTSVVGKGEASHHNNSRSTATKGASSAAPTPVATPIPLPASSNPHHTAAAPLFGFKASRSAAAPPPPPPLSNRNLGKDTLHRLMLEDDDDEDDNGDDEEDEEADYNAMLAKAFGSVGGQCDDDSNMLPPQELHEALLLDGDEDDDDEDDEALFFSNLKQKKQQNQAALMMMGGSGNDGGARQRRGWGPAGGGSKPPPPPAHHATAAALAPTAAPTLPSGVPQQRHQQQSLATVIELDGDEEEEEKRLLSPPPLLPPTTAAITLVHPADSGLLPLRPFTFTPTCVQAIPLEECILIGFVNGDVAMLKLGDVPMSTNLE